MASQIGENKPAELSDVEVDAVPTQSKKSYARRKGNPKKLASIRASREGKKQNSKLSSKAKDDEGFEEGDEIEEGGDEVTGLAEHGSDQDVGIEEQVGEAWQMNLQLRPKDAAPEVPAVGTTTLLGESETSLDGPAPNKQPADELELYKAKNKHLEEQLAQKDCEISQRDLAHTELSNTNYDMTCDIESLLEEILQLQLELELMK